LQELFAQHDQLGLLLLVLGQPLGGLAAVARLAVDVLQEAGQLVAELLVVVGTAEPAGVAEVNELDPAHRALVVQDGRLVGLLDRDGVVNYIRMRDLFAQGEPGQPGR